MMLRVEPRLSYKENQAAATELSNKRQAKKTLNKLKMVALFQMLCFALVIRYSVKLRFSKVLIERSCHTKFYERSLQTPSSEQNCQSAKFHYSAFTRDVT